MYAIIENGNKQYKVSEGDVVRVEKLNAEVGATVEFKAVLVSADDGIKVGADVANAKVSAKVEAQDKFKRSSCSNTRRKRTSAKNKAIASPSPRSRSKRSRCKAKASAAE